MILTKNQINHEVTIRHKRLAGLQPASYDIVLGAHGFVQNKPTILDKFISRDRWKLAVLPYTLRPGEIIMLTSNEIVKIPSGVAALLTLRSSVGRSGIFLTHAGYGDPGFCGTWTFVIKNESCWGYCLKPETSIAQLIFFRCEAGDDVYAGKYQNQHGPTLSKGV